MTWLATSLVISLARFLTIQKYKYNPTTDDDCVQKRLLKFRIGALASGVAWSITSVYLFPTDSFQHQLFITLALAGLSAGGIVSYSVDIISAVTYSLIILAPILVRMLLGDNSIHVSIGVSGILYLAFMIVTTIRINRHLIENIILHFEAVEREKEITMSEERYRLLLNHSPVGIAHYDNNFNVTYCNQNLADILGSNIEQIMHRNLTVLKDRSILPILNEALLGKIGRYEGQFASDISNVSGWIDLTTAPSRDATGNVVGGIAIVQDITLQKQAVEEIKQLAFYDLLTGLPNRRLLFDRLEHALNLSARTNKSGALLFLDLDHFKLLNDTLGHDMGDLLLKQVAERLTACVRDMDTVARIGGDEFVVMLEDLSKDNLEAKKQVESISKKIIDSLNQPYQLGKYQHHNTPSIGIAMFGEHGKSHEELLKHADLAMYEAKKAGRNVIQLFNHKMQSG